MLKLGDFFYLPQVSALVEQMIADGPGLRVVAGLDPRPASMPAVGSGFLPSGRSTVFRILAREALEAQPSARIIVVAEDRELIRVPRQLRPRVEFALVTPPYTYSNRIIEAASRRPDLLVIDHLSTRTAPEALEAARQGVRVLSQLDTVFRGAGVARHLLDLAVSQEQLASLTWVVAVQRLPTLCPRCKQPAAPGAPQLDRLRQLYPNFEALLGGQDAAFFQAAGCADCRYSGRLGDAAVFDIFHADPAAPDHFAQPSALPAEEYVLHLALRGQLALDDVLQFGADEFRRTYNHLVASQNALMEANAALERKLVEIEAANRVLEQRTRALVSLQEVGQALIASTDLDELAARVCRQARDLCGADRAILYFLHADEQAEVLAVAGWNPAFVGQRLDIAPALEALVSAEPRPYPRWPPGIPPRHPDVEGARLRAGLAVPLMTQDGRVGLMIVHSTQKSNFLPGEAALLQTFANQAALAIQRAGLFDQLRAKIAQLEAAQAELARKERIERELELARQVQQNVLPRAFPSVPGYRFAARNEPAHQVGGDFYDVIALDADHFGVAIADVSDKGMPAALYMALTRSLLRAEAHRERAPLSVIANVNQLLIELGEPNMFVTVFYGVVERATRRLTYIRAGHDRPLLLRDGAVRELGGQGVALGFLDRADLRLAEAEVVLSPGDRLVLYTDGLIDAQAPDGLRVGRGQLKARLQAYAHLPPEPLCDAIFADLIAYQGAAEQFDDMTLLVVGVE